MRARQREMDILEGVAKALLSPRRFYRDAMRERESLQRTTSSYRSSAAARTTTTSREIRSLYEEIMWPNDNDKDGGRRAGVERVHGVRVRIKHLKLTTERFGAQMPPELIDCISSISFSCLSSSQQMCSLLVVSSKRMTLPNSLM